jgi:hypothetical protein
MPFTPSGNLIEQYLDIKTETEAPIVFHRWAMMTCIAANLGRNVWYPFGQDNIYPNMYVMIVGDPGTRKSTAIKNSKAFLVDSGYERIAADKSSKEKFLSDLAIGFDKLDEDGGLEIPTNMGGKEFLATLYANEDDVNAAADCLICADEFNSFLGHGNIEFVDLLTNLWDYRGVYRNRIKTGKSIRINNPTINLLGGNTPTGISMAFPPEVIGQGFFSRLLLIFSESSGRRIPFPPPIAVEDKKRITDGLTSIRTTLAGEITCTADARELLASIYHENFELGDLRFKHYSSRRFDHLIKLCIVCAASSLTTEINMECVLYANSILHMAEFNMPKALGEFGKARNSDVTTKILDSLAKADKPMHIETDIWPLVSRDLDKIQHLGEIMAGLLTAHKVQHIKGQGFMPIRPMLDPMTPFTQFTLLREYLHSLE